MSASTVDSTTDSTAAPRWLLPLVLGVHAGAGGILLTLPAPAAPPQPPTLEVALLRLPAPAQPPARPPAVVPAPAPRPAPVRPPPALAALPLAATDFAAARPTPAADTATAAAPVPAPATPPSRFDAAYLDNPRPAYPAVARRLREQGKTVLRVRVSAEGLPEQIEVRESAGSPRLDEAAANAVRRWRFVPARQDGQAVAAWVLVPLIFKLEN